MKVWVGPVGEMRRVSCLPSVGVEVERSSVVLDLLDGSRFEQRGVRGFRSWSWELPFSEVGDVAWLLELASGGVVGPFFLYSSKAAVENLAPVSVQSCAGFSGVVGGRRVVGVADGAVTVRVPVRPGTEYVLSALGDGVGVVSAVFGGTPSNGYGFGPYGSGPYGE